jgi:hypothetical protein
MDIMEQAAYTLVHDYANGKHKGAPALANYLHSHFGYKIQPGTLMNKANPDQSHQFTVNEAVLIQRAQGKFNYLYAEAHVLNHSAVPLGDFSTTSDLEFLNTYTQMHKALGDLASVINEAFKDRAISRNEVKQVRTAGMATIRAILEMESRITALCDESCEYGVFGG